MGIEPRTFLMHGDRTLYTDPHPSHFFFIKKLERGFYQADQAGLELKADCAGPSLGILLSSGIAGMYFFTLSKVYFLLPCLAGWWLQPYPRFLHCIIPVHIYANGYSSLGVQGSVNLLLYFCLNLLAEFSITFPEFYILWFIWRCLILVTFS